MAYNNAPKFGKVEILLKVKTDVTISPTQSVQSVDKLEFNDCGLMITGDYIIVILDEKNEVNNTLTSTGNIFHLSQVMAYKTHAS